jgi:dephospho-CoA kinase
VLRVGLTGGLASGKSTVAGILRGLGAEVFDADAIVRELYAPGGAGTAAARALFGEGAIDESGAVDRARVAGFVFADAEKRRALEALIHPMVRAELERRFDEARRAGARIAVAEASQILEAGSESAYDRLLLVVAPEGDRIRRWVARGGDAEDARRRMASQIPSAAARARATDVVENDGTVEELRGKVERIYRDWLALEGI